MQVWSNLITEYEKTKEKFKDSHVLILQGLCHISELSSNWLAKAEDVSSVLSSSPCFFLFF